MAVTCNPNDPNQVVVYTIAYETYPKRIQTPIDGTLRWVTAQTADTSSQYVYVKTGMYIDRDRSGGAQAMQVDFKQSSPNEEGPAPKRDLAPKEIFSPGDQFVTYNDDRKGGGFTIGNVLDCSLPQYQVGPWAGRCQEAKDEFIQNILVSRPINVTVRCEPANFQAPERLAETGQSLRAHSLWSHSL